VATSVPGRSLLLCVPNIGKRPNNTQRLYTLGLLYLRAAAEEVGWSCRLVDAYFDDLGVEETVERLTAGDRPDLLGFTLNSERCATPRWLSWPRLDARGGPRIPVVVGGFYASVKHAELLERHPRFDHVVRGEGEATLRELLRRFGGAMPMSDVLGLSARDLGGASRSAERRPVADELDSLAFGWTAWGARPRPESGASAPAAAAARAALIV